jgi:hypothetical protein
VRHFIAAGCAEDGARCAALAAREALGGLDFEGATRYFSVALEHASWDRETERELQMGQAEAFGNAGRSLDAALCWSAAATDAPEDVALLCHRRAAASFLGSGRLDRGYEVLRSVLAREGVDIPQRPLQILGRTFLARSKATFWLRWRRSPRPGASARELERVDAFWHAAEILSMIDTGRGAYFQALHLAASLRCGEPARMGRAMGLETSYRVASGWNRRGATRRLQQRALRVAESSGDPLARGIAMGGRSLGLYMEGRWRESLEANLPIEDLYKKEAVGVWWERATGALYTILACFRTGDLDAVRWLERRWLADARDRGDLYVASSVAATASARLRLMDDRPDQAAEAVREGLSVGLGDTFLAQHFWSEREAVTIALYRGDPSGARAVLDRLWPRLRASLLLYFVDIRIEALALRSRVALANAFSARGGAYSDIRALRRDTFLLGLERVEWARAHADALRGMGEVVRGSRQRAAALLERAEQRFERAGMPIEAACVRWRRSQIVDAAQRDRLRHDGEEVLHRRGIARPERWAAAMLPLPTAAHSADHP